MKNFLQVFLDKYRYETLFFLILIAAIVVRFINYEHRIVFDSEQARSLIVSGNYVKDKFSLLGQEYFRATSTGHKLFSGAIFSYLLLPIQLLANYDVLKITQFFTVLNLFSGTLLFFISSKLWGKKVGLISATLFLFSDMMIKHSLFIWILNWVPLLGVLTLYTLYLFNKNKRIVNVLALGLLLGIGINFHYPILFYAGMVGVYILVKSRKRLLSALIYFLGLIAGNLPTLLFDLRHDWYHVRTLIQYILDTFNGNGQNFSYYYLFLIWPVMCVMVSLIFTRVLKGNILLIFVIVIYIVLNLNSKWVNFSSANEMPQGLSYKDVIRASEIIANDKPERFNVSTLFGFDARGYILRYPLEYNYGYAPSGAEEYKELNALYVMALGDSDIKNPSRYELKTYLQYNYELLGEVNSDYQIYKLTKK